MRAACRGRARRARHSSQAVMPSETRRRNPHTLKLRLLEADFLPAVDRKPIMKPGVVGALHPQREFLWAVSWRIDIQRERDRKRRLGILEIRERLKQLLYSEAVLFPEFMK